ncbi:MAG: hypothetical protein COU35_04955 [Candidatus Magasanikbacteria bacterium CG10_big_fil_rev_8_21_14_0_10_47_10]|uniref:GIY-YIG domain-containing protein n=1 Tax=Candidatus Magasanikbacteria bacterium CG10_big_fil_rev_8_21_14_0_10_47_10 TaxID=1974652 RepID=A0A2H0TR12_9BACT|nr:MAG: hypothetical protein COU35_04955 [Candidatus Magasanikbacteria bacterium CG10_big_fil_rev_8_21_14_0_10_47_10]
MKEGFFYILQSEKTDGYYIGSCCDLTKRLSEHARGHTQSTRKQKPWKLVYTECYTKLEEARAREREVKRWKSHNRMYKLITR